MEIKLGGKGEFTVCVDSEDFERLSKHRWSAHTGYSVYAIRWSSGKYIYMHREILGASDGEVVDHINGDTTDNRKSNLRICTASENKQNLHKISGSSKFQGVYWDRFNKKWRVQITKDRKIYTFGRFTDEIEAAKIYDQNITKLFGHGAKLNFKE